MVIDLVNSSRTVFVEWSETKDQGNATTKEDSNLN